MLAIALETSLLLWTGTGTRAEVCSSSLVPLFVSSA